jgi:hypothetical protein
MAAAAPPSRCGLAAAEWTIDSEHDVGADSLPAVPPALSVVDRIASPRGYVTELLALAEPLDAGRLRAALARVVAQIPSLGCRAALDDVSRGRMAGR